MLVLSGLAVIIAGFALRLNPLAVVVVAAMMTGLAAGMGLPGTVAAIGKAFNDTRYVTAIWLVLPAIGLLERGGLRERAAALIGSFRGARVGRLLILYLLFRQTTAALGLNAVAGQAQTVRPLVAPMAEAAAGPIPPEHAARVRAWAAATDNVGVFFGEDIFVAVASILLIQAFLAANGIPLAPLSLSLWAIPTAVAAFLVQGARLLRLDRRVARGQLP